MGRGRILGGALVAVTAAIVLLVLPATPASAYIYWSDFSHQTIGRANNDGSGVNDSFIHTGAGATGVAVDAAHIYWANQNENSIGRAGIDGSGVNNSFITGAAKPTGVAVNGSSLFWSSIEGPIGRANIDGTGKNTEFIKGVSESCGVTVDVGHVYWVDLTLGTSYIGRSSLNGGFVQNHFVTIPGTAFPCGVGVNSANIYWADTGFLGGGTTIGRADVLDGEGPDPSFIHGASSPCGVAVVGSQLYWANSETGTIARANTDGTGVNETFFDTGGGEGVCDPAVDSLSAAPTSNPGQGDNPGQGSSGQRDTIAPQTKITTGPGKGLAKGKAKFAFRSSEAGSRFECKLDRKKVARCKSPRRYTGLKPGRHSFSVWAIDAAGNKDPTPAKRSFRVPAG
jgi:hypothetical protein